jgi:Ser/Thr protein kinase RdoA (MazF antagonist)/nicotinamidase-related amidase
MSWKTKNRSFYYELAEEPDNPPLDPATTALLVIDVQNVYLARPDRDKLAPERERLHYDGWTPFYNRLTQTVIPNIAELLGAFRARGMHCIFARIACHKKDGADRSLSQKKPGFNNILLPKDEHASQIADALAPQGDEIVVTKTTDSALTGTNLRLILTNLGIKTVICVGVFTDQCVSSTVRSLADESFDVVVLEDCCAAGTDELHARELEIINMIYCNVMTLADLKALMGLSDTSERTEGQPMYSEDFIGQLESGLRAALPRWGFGDDAELSLLTVSENATFRARDAASGRDVVFRVHRQGYHTREEIASELAWLAALNSEGIVDTLTPIPQIDGKLIADIDDNGTTRHVVAFEFVPGKEPDETSGLAGWFHELGAVSAWLHAHSRSWTPPEGFIRKTWNFRTTLGDAPLWGDWREGLGLTREDRRILEEVAAMLRQRLADYGEDAEKFGLVHADLRLANLIIDGERLSVIDFDDCGFSWYLYDFAAAISFLEHEPYIPELLDAWIAGYRTVAPLSDADAAIIPTFIMLRRMLLTAWIASHSETPMAQQTGEAYTRGTVALGRAFLAEHAEAAAETGSGSS